MEALGIVILVLFLLIAFRNNRFVKPIANFIAHVVLTILFATVGGFIGFFVGYLSFGQIKIVLPDIGQVKINISLETIFSGQDKLVVRE